MNAKKSQFKILFVIAIAAMVLTSCGSTYRIYSSGELSLASTRNIDKSETYVPLKTYAGVSSTDIEAARSAAKNGVIRKKHPIIKEIDVYKGRYLQDAIDNVVKSVPGGEYIYNLKLYTVVEETASSKKPNVYRYVVSGDVWGVQDANANIKGFRVGDKIMFNYNRDVQKLLGKSFTSELNKQINGEVISLKGTAATVQLEDSTILEIPYHHLTIVNK